MAACHIVTRHKLDANWLVPFAAALALTGRLIAWQVPPVFSDDLYRYRWEGRIQAQGENPYAVRPSERPDLVTPEDHRMPGHDFKAVYGPLVLLTERLAYWVSGENLLYLRWPFALADLLTLAVFALRFGLRGWVLYGWCPLAVFEFWSGGHNDSVCLLALVLALWAFAAGRDAAGWVALGCAVLTKWWPAMLIPLFLRSRWRSAYWVLAPAVVLTPLYWTNARENAQFASGFVGGWRNNDSLFGALLGLTGDLYQAKYLAFALLAMWVAWLSVARMAEPRRALLAVAGLLLLSANVHPWYLTWMLPFVAEAALPFVFVWMALAPVTFAPAIIWRTTGVWDGVLPSRWWVYGCVFASMLVGVLERCYDRTRKGSSS